jgi:hypothetical protein
MDRKEPRSLHYGTLGFHGRPGQADSEGRTIQTRAGTL